VLHELMEAEVDEGERDGEYPALPSAGDGQRRHGGPGGTNAATTAVSSPSAKPIAAGMPWSSTTRAC
jgi:hypothetical protein